MSHRIAIVGHSFVARLEESLKSDNIPLDTSLGLPSCNVKYFGLRGATTQKLIRSNELIECENFRPDTVFIQCGGNDISPDSTVVTVVEGIRDLVDKLQTIDSVKLVIIGSLFPRAKPRYMTKETYNSEMCKINSFLEKHYSPHSNVHFWRIRGLQNPKWNIFLNDGVHLNDKATKMYAFQVKMAVGCRDFR
ncbi:hypothetical protein FSP39_008242 [Pinctada imbricata]|nr:hypothetical protein FSP39_008242 [Pinctada imbricata]